MQSKINNLGFKSYINIEIKNHFRFPRQVIYIVYSENSKKYWLNYATNLYLSLNSLVDLMETPKLSAMVSDLDDLKLSVVEKNVPNATAKIKLIYKYRKKMEAMGYSLYCPIKHCQYQLKETIEIDKTNGRPFVVLYLKDRHKNYEPILLGVFDSKEECSNFRNRHYRNNIIKEIVVSDNELTAIHLKMLNQTEEGEK